MAMRLNFIAFRIIFNFFASLHLTQIALNCSKSTMETPEQYAKSGGSRSGVFIVNF